MCEHGFEGPVTPILRKGFRRQLAFTPSDPLDQTVNPHIFPKVPFDNYLTPINRVI